MVRWREKHGGGPYHVITLEAGDAMALTSWGAIKITRPDDEKPTLLELDIDFRGAKHTSRDELLVNPNNHYYSGVGQIKIAAIVGFAEDKDHTAVWGSLSSSWYEVEVDESAHEVFKQWVREAEDIDADL